VIPPRSHRHLLVSGGTLVTMDSARRVVEEDVLITDGRIAAIGRNLETPPATRLLDARGLHVLPGLIQGHVHLGQSLFRGLAEDRTLLSWLRDRIWPLEAAHTEESAYWSAMLGAADCLLSGTTTVQEIGLVRGMNGVFRAVLDSGLRAVAGKCLMDTGAGVPARLAEDAARGLAEAEELHRRWHGEGRGRIRGAVCPRFILSCSPRLWDGAVGMARSLGAPVHTHLLESREEEASVREALGRSQMEFLDELGVLDADLRVAHAVWLGERELDVLGDRRLGIVHCPSANLKLGSGIADLVFLRSRANLTVGIGTDGAPCNNDMDVLEEMRLAALLAGFKRGPGAFRAEEALELATVEGARAIGLGDELGSLEPGKAGDLVVLDLDRPQTFGPERVSVYDRVIYAAGRDAVRWVVVDGEVRVDAGHLPHLDPEALRRRPKEEIRALLARVELN
jgi:5-methylthioadenosine/S-adenosylhomocysteine deaminase